MEDKAVTAAIPRAPTGSQLTCKGWEQEAALRMLLNSIDADVAEQSAGSPPTLAHPEHIKAIVAALRDLEKYQTLIVSSGRPVGVFRAQSETPRVVIAPEAAGDRSLDRAADWLYVGAQTGLPAAYESLAAVAHTHFGGTFAGKLVAVSGLGGEGGALPLAATLHGAAVLGIDADANQIKRRMKAGYCEAMVNDLDEALRILKNSVRKRESASVGLIGNSAEVIVELARRGIVPDLLLDSTLGDGYSNGYIPRGLSGAQAADLRCADHQAYREKALQSIETQIQGMLELQRLGSLAFRMSSGRESDNPNLILQTVSQIPNFSSEFIEPLFAENRTLLLWVALSGAPADISAADRLALEIFGQHEAATRYLQLAGRHVQFQGLPARLCLVDRALGARFGVALNEMVAQGAFRAPLLLGCADTRHRNRSTSKPGSEETTAVSTTTEFNQMLASLSTPASAASIAVTHRGPRFRSAPDLAIVADGTSAVAKRIARLFSAERNSE